MPPHGPVPGAITATESVGWTWDYSYVQRNEALQNKARTFHPVPTFLTTAVCFDPMSRQKRREAIVTGYLFSRVDINQFFTTAYGCRVPLCSNGANSRRVKVAHGENEP
ncbi:hypothetical protein AVEN_8044-1 [Araneus ventricosus]|uniref:Uncharacterized protein n=1 Tax=Araneus ventricosus TaxID=182803 RepID=A0A4Y2UYC9_ARAVE|nr:hypothetical protein AVEN_8044-1 [Araneus ventricosus]